ncbi:MAG: autotransporter outer membrane beta-barrel domain-containing protein [Planctomycetaceae bacterium]|jgi:outer membrane autotransporter protein|nr:autotransporter outer membrane beta-barrel domain-containing protein [Planctomycetaceae bacterium]
MKLFQILQLVIIAIVFFSCSLTAEETENLFTFSNSLEVPIIRGNLKNDDRNHWQYRLWAVPYGNWAELQSDDAALGFYSNAFGFMAGFDRKWNQRIFWNWGAGGSWISANGTRNSGDKEIDAFKTKWEAVWNADEWRFKIGGGYGYNSQKTLREDFSRTFCGRNHANQWGGFSEFQLNIGSGLFQMEPFVAVDYFNLSENGFTERQISGDGIARTSERTSKSSFNTTLGVRYRWRQTGRLVIWRPELSAAWSHEFHSDEIFRSSRLDPFPTLYTFSGNVQPRDRLIFSVGIIGNLGQSMDIFARYDADFVNDYNAHAVLCGTTWYF